MRCITQRQGKKSQAKLNTTVSRSPFLLRPLLLRLKQWYDMHETKNMMSQESIRPPTEHNVALSTTWYAHALSIHSHNNGYILHTRPPDTWLVSLSLSSCSFTTRIIWLSFCNTNVAPSFDLHRLVKTLREKRFQTATS